MIAPFTLPLDVEVWADREADLKALFRELHETDPEQGDVQQGDVQQGDVQQGDVQQPEGAR